MGQFSWIYSDTNKAMKDNKRHDSFLLIPERFAGKYGEYIKETCYDGYGRFGDVDVYELVAEFNRDYIPTVIGMMELGLWQCTMDMFEGDRHYIEILKAYYTDGSLGTDFDREVGIALACYDKDNFRLPYPIKIVETPVKYDVARPSETDPNQGW